MYFVLFNRQCHCFECSCDSHDYKTQVNNIFAMGSNDKRLSEDKRSKLHERIDWQNQITDHLKKTNWWRQLSSQ